MTLRKAKFNSKLKNVSAAMHDIAEKIYYLLSSGIDHQLKDFDAIEFYRGGYYVHLSIASKVLCVKDPSSNDIWLFDISFYDNDITIDEYRYDPYDVSLDHHLTGNQWVYTI